MTESTQQSVKTINFIERAIEKHSGKYDYKNVEYVNAVTKINIICKVHEWEFLQIPNDHLNGHGCRKCAGSYQYTTPEFITAAIKIHGNRYDYSRVAYINNRTKIKIICKVHEWEFLQTPDNHLSGKGCSKCARSYQYTTPEFITAAIKIHGNRYDYSRVAYINNNTKIKIICKVHEWEFLQIPSTHLQGSGCSKCGGSYQPTTPEFIANAVKVHGDKYDYSRVAYINNNTKIKIICKVHEWEFLQTPSDHLQGHGCGKCGSKFIREHIIGKFLKRLKTDFETQKRFEGCKNKLTLPFDYYLPDFDAVIEHQGQQHYFPIEFWGGEEAFKKQQLNDAIKKQYCDENNIHFFEIRYDEDIKDKLIMMYETLGAKDKVQELASIENIMIEEIEDIKIDETFSDDEDSSEPIENPKKINKKTDEWVDYFG